MTEKIWVLTLEDGTTFWKLQGEMAWSRDIVALMNIIKNGYEVKFCDSQNDSIQWE